MRLILALCFCVGSFTCYGEFKLARINDSDGFTYVRAEAGTGSKIIDSVRTDELFLCEPSSGEWWRIKTIRYEGKGTRTDGFMHRSRVQLIELLSNRDKASFLQDILIKQKQLANRFGVAFDTKDSSAYPVTRRELERHSDLGYSCALPLLAKYVCETSDSALLKLFFETVWEDRGSANEMPSVALGEMFVCKTELMVRELARFNAEQRSLVADHIEWGIRGYYDVPEEGLDIAEPDKSNVEKFNALMKRLKSIK